MRELVHDVVQDMGFELAVHPDSLVISASLGNVNAIDATLPDDNPYRKVRCLQQLICSASNISLALFVGLI